MAWHGRPSALVGCWVHIEEKNGGYGAGVVIDTRKVAKGEATEFLIEFG
jgi:hypothetical protein